MSQRMNKKFAELLMLVFFLLIGVIAIFALRGEFKVFLIETTASEEESTFHINNQTAKTLASINDVKSDSANTIVIVTASWCGQCEALKNSLMNELNSEIAYKDQDVEVVEISIDNNRQVLSQIGVTEVPSIIAIENDRDPIVINNLSIQNVGSVLSSIL